MADTSIAFISNPLPANIKTVPFTIKIIEKVIGLKVNMDGCMDALNQS